MKRFLREAIARKIPDRLSSHKLCTGCGACSVSCKAGAITLVPDVYGFLYPRLDAEKCVRCGKCLEICPVKYPALVDVKPRCFVARSNDKDLLKRSTSGGVFSELAYATIKDDGAVYGCRLTEKSLTPVHIRVTTNEEIKCLCGSKYVQSDLGTVYNQVLADLVAHRKVLFTGTPCQIAGLYKICDASRICVADRDNLLTMELLCHGAPSYKMFNFLLQDLRKRHRGNGDLMDVSFRQKVPVWGTYSIGSRFSNGTSFVESSIWDNWYSYAFIARLITRPSCANCCANNGRSGADITVGDYWGVERFHPEFADGEGVSAIMVHTQRGLDALRRTTLHLIETHLEWITEAGKSYNAPRKGNPWASIFCFASNYFNPRLLWGGYWASVKLLELPRRAIRKIMRCKKK